MNKKETAAFEALRTQLALRWPTEARPKPVDFQKLYKRYGNEDGILETGKDLYVGWHFTASGYGRTSVNVEQGCSNGIYHSTYSTTKTTSQGAGVFYATKREAYLAARWKLCDDFAKALAQCDKYVDEIDAELVTAATKDQGQ